MSRAAGQTVAAIAVLARRRAAVVAIESTSTPVPYQSGWITLTNGIEVQLSPGASLRIAHRRLVGLRHVLLDGTARFRVPDLDIT